MATFTAVNATAPTRFDLFNVTGLLSGTPNTSDATTFTIGADADNFTAFSGSGFAYSAGLFNAGRINRIDSVAGGQTQFQLDGLSMSVAQFRAFVNTGNSQGFLAAALGGNDTLTGSAFSDYLQGFAGNDLIQNNPGSPDNDTLDGGTGADTMDGGDGNDLYIVDNAKDSILADSGGIDSVQSSITLTLAAGLEHLFLTGKAAGGTGNDLANQIAGNAVNNNLKGLAADDGLDGGGGNDTLDGGSGDDTMLGGAGNDTYFVDSIDDKIVESLAGKSGGIDRVFSTVDITLSDNVENLQLTGSANVRGHGNSANNLIVGNSGINELAGFGGNDTLIGGDGADELHGGDGADLLNGGKGGDFYIFDALDKVVESLAGPDGGIDTAVYIGAGSYTLGRNLENLSLVLGTAVAGIGNALDNVIGGNGLDNTLDGKGGKDSLDGQFGSDVFIVDSSGDKVTDTFGTFEIDTVRSSVDFDLGGAQAFGDIENLVLTGKAATGAGNVLPNQITGNAARNSLSGLTGNDTLDGGAGSDTLVGNDGNDLYVIDSKLDLVLENGADAADQINSSKVSVDISGMLLTTIENIQLTGKLALNATGNAANNVITGNDGANNLSGLGGNDTLIGGAGNDTLAGSDSGDKLIGGSGNDVYLVGFEFTAVDESTGSGIDLVISSANFFSLSGPIVSGDIENLTLAAAAGNSAGFGNDLANILTGNDATNDLEGLGGNDTINGAGGDDFVRGNSGDDTIIVSNGNDLILYFMLDGSDVIVGFDGNPDGGQDRFSLDGLFSQLMVPEDQRASHVMIVDQGATVEVRVDADLNLANGYETLAATLQTNDAVTLGSDVVLFF